MYYHSLNYISNLSDNINSSVSDYINQKNKLATIETQIIDLNKNYLLFEEKLFQSVETLSSLMEFYIQINAGHIKLLQLKDQCINDTNKIWIDFSLKRIKEEKQKGRVFFQLIELYNYINGSFDYVDSKDKVTSINWLKSIDYSMEIEKLSKKCINILDMKNQTSIIDARVSQRLRHNFNNDLVKSANLN